MAENMTQTPAPQPPVLKKKRRKKHIFRKLVSLVLVCGLVAGGFYGWKKLTAEDEVPLDVLTDQVLRGTISTKVEGSGMLVSKTNASISIPSDGVVEQLLVKEGDFVTQGQPLYRIASPTLMDSIRKSREELDKLEQELTDLQEQKDHLTITAPADGQLQDAAQLTLGQTLPAGTPIATLVENTRLRLSQYYSYTYQNEIAPGQKATVSVPAVMAQLEGTVEQINLVRRVSPEGSLLFEVIFVLDNPGTLTADMLASAVMQTGSGETIYPYEQGKLSFYNTQVISVRTSGPVERFDLLNYGAVTAGQVLAVLGSDSIDAQITAQEGRIAEAKTALERLEGETQKLEATAPIEGTVMSLGLAEGGSVTAGGVAITISDNRTLQLNASVDERNISYIKSGMPVDIDQWGTMSFGTVESVSLNSSQQGSMATFPVVISVDNSAGSLMVNSYCTFQFASNVHEDVLYVPIQAVKYVETAEGSTSVVFVQSETAPAGTVELAAPIEGIPEGYWPVKVETGLADTSNVEIVSGLEEGQVIFLQTVKSQASSWM